MKNCIPEVTSSNSQDIFEEWGAMIGFGIIKKAMSGNGDPEIDSSLRNIQAITQRGNCEEMNPAAKTRAIDRRNDEITYAFYESLGPSEPNEEMLQRIVEGIKELSNSLGISENDSEESPVGEIPITNDSTEWFFKEKYERLTCVVDSDPLPFGKDEILLFGKMSLNGTQIETREFEKNGVGDGDIIDPKLTYGIYPIYRGVSVFHSIEGMLDKDGFEDQVLNRVPDEMDILFRALRKRVTEEIEKSLEKVSSSSFKNKLNELILRALFILIVQGVNRVTDKLSDLIAGYLEPDFFNPIYITTTINYDGITTPTWSVLTKSIGKPKQGKLNIGQGTETVGATHKEVDKSDKGEYKTINKITVFRVGSIA